MDCNRLLKFSKENADVGLVYNYIGEVQDLRLLCFFDAAFATRSDGSSQVGYIILLIHKSLLARSSLGTDWALSTCASIGAACLTLARS